MLDFYQCVNWLFKLKHGPCPLTTDKRGERFYLHIAIKAEGEEDFTQEFPPVSVFPNQTELKTTNIEMNDNSGKWSYDKYSHPKACKSWTFSAGHFISKHTKKFDVDDIRSWYDHSPKALALGVLHGDAHSGATFALAVNEIYDWVAGRRDLVEVYVSLDT